MRILVAAAVALLAAGCESPTGASGGSEVRATMIGDAGGASRQMEGAGVSSTASGQASGTVDLRARIWIRAEGGGWREVTRGWTAGRVEISGRDGGHLLAAGRVEAARYDRVRVEFQEIRARVEGGGGIDLGLLTGEIRVDLAGSGSTRVEREVVVDTRGDGSAALQIDLNAGQWLRRADGPSRTVAEAEFRSAVRVTVE